MLYFFLFNIYEYPEYHQHQYFQMEISSYYQLKNLLEIFPKYNGYKTNLKYLDLN